MGLSYEVFESELEKASTPEERVGVAVQGLSSNRFVRNIQAVDKSELEQMKKRDPDLFASLQPEAVREALVLTGFFRYSLSKGLPAQREIELEDMPSCSRRDFIIFTEIFTSREDALPSEDWASGPDAVKIALKSMVILHAELKPMTDELGEGSEHEVFMPKLSRRQLRALRNVLSYTDSHLMRNRVQISKLLEVKL